MWVESTTLDTTFGLAANISPDGEDILHFGKYLRTVNKKRSTVEKGFCAA
jgi:hypothetical protein